MKKSSFLVAMGILALPALASAGRAYGMAGCGIGALVFQDQPGMIQIVAATLNATAGSQTFGITTGTSNCTDTEQVASLDQENFLKTNYANVLRDAAVGQGEYLATFATLLGCEEASHDAFFDLAREHHGELFSSDSAAVVLDNVKGAAKENAELRASCARI